MSRYTIENVGENKSLTYGWDHALGYFYDITDTSKNEDDPGFLIKWKAPQKHLLAISLDVPF